MKSPHRVFTTQLEDGSHVVASFDSPRFCVGGKTLGEALLKAERALAFFFASDDDDDKFRQPAKSPKTTKVFRPVFAEETICAN